MLVKFHPIWPCTFLVMTAWSCRCMDMDEAVDEPLQVLECVVHAYSVYPQNDGRFLQRLMKIGQVVSPWWWFLSTDNCWSCWGSSWREVGGLYEWDCQRGTIIFIFFMKRGFDWYAETYTLSVIIYKNGAGRKNLPLICIYNNRNFAAPKRRQQPWWFFAE